MIRPATSSDIDTIADVFLASFAGLSFLPALHTDEETRTWIREEMVPRHEVWVAEANGRVLGFAALTGGLLGHLYVHPDAQSRGVGSALLDVVKAERPDGFRFWVFQRNAGARRFYERHGCRLVELTDGRDNEEKEPDALYEWRSVTAGPLLSDLDGTIADTAPVIFASLRVTCAAMAIDLGRDADLSFALGPPLHHVLEALGVEADRLDAAIAIFEAAHTERIEQVVPMPGADVVVEELAEAGVAIGVATIKPRPIAELVLRALGLRDFIGCVRGRDDDLDPRTKTDLLREVARESPGSSPLYVGDHDNDAEAAAALSIPFLRYPDNSWEDIRAAVLARSAEPAPRGADARGSSAR